MNSDDLIENTEPRAPCVLLLDTSKSMDSRDVVELSAALASYKQELLADPRAARRVEVAIVTFGGRVSRLSEFTSAARLEPPQLDATGGTPLGEAIGIALGMIEERIAAYREHNIAFYRPWAFLITDGEATDYWKPVVSRVHVGEEEKSLCFFAAAVEGADITALKEICVRQALWLQDMKFRELFGWLANSQKAVCRSTPGDDVPLEDPTSGPGAWAKAKV